MIWSDGAPPCGHSRCFISDLRVDQNSSSSGISSLDIYGLYAVNSSKMASSIPPSFLQVFPFCSFINCHYKINWLMTHSAVKLIDQLASLIIFPLCFIIPWRVRSVLKTLKCFTSYHTSNTNSPERKPSSWRAEADSFLILIGTRVAQAASRFLPLWLAVGAPIRLVQQGGAVGRPGTLVLIVGVDFMLLKKLKQLKKTTDYLI